MTVLLVALGAALGAPTRYLVGRCLPGPRSTLLVNIFGSGLLGLLVHPSASTSALVGTGFCGALTTFSSFAVEAVDTRSWRYVTMSVVLCVGAAALTRSVAG